MTRLKLSRTILVISVALTLTAGFVMVATCAQGQGPKKTPPGWEKGEKKGWFSDVPPGLAKKEGWIPPGWSKGEKEGWMGAYPPGWEKRRKGERENWIACLSVAKNSIKVRGKKQGLSDEESEEIASSLEIASRMGVPIKNTEGIVKSAIDKGMRGPAIEKLLRAVAYGVGKEIKFEQLGRFVNKKLDAGLRGEELALEVYKEVQRRQEEKKQRE